LTAKTLQRLRDICLALPEVEERESWGHPTFRIGGKIFAVYGDDDDGPRVTCKAPPGSQTILVGADPKRFFVPRYVGLKGWVGVRLAGRVSWREVALLVERSWGLTAPKRLSRARDVKKSG